MQSSSSITVASADQASDPYIMIGGIADRNAAVVLLFMSFISRTNFPGNPSARSALRRLPGSSNQNADRNEAGPHEEVKQVAICSSMDPITRDVERRVSMKRECSPSEETMSYLRFTRSNTANACIRHCCVQKKLTGCCS
ncbi:hypothetical protein RB195_022755 [Necator americanus]|uniref:Uncharacterized protein n=1 Tax=Necator americanus TaxID=51031 RepID=A0ABR1EGG2_NECAM